MFLLVGSLVTSQLLQINAINAATEAACLILSVDETVKNPKVFYVLFHVLLEETDALFGYLSVETCSCNCIMSVCILM